MKIQVLDQQGKKTSEIDTNIFDNKIRKDIIQKVVEIEKIKQPYSPALEAGKQASASGKVRHGRRRWKSAAGRGISRIPRKIFWRRGTQFYWQGATISSAVGGRRAHPPKVLGMINTKKINKKEKKIAFLSALALTTSLNDIQEKYENLKNKEIKIKLPLVIDDKMLDLNTKQFLESLKKILNGFWEIAIKKKAVRAGKGKKRGRKYKKTGGMLLVMGNNKNKKISGIEIKKANAVSITNLASNGARLVVYTKQAINDLEKRLAKKEKVKTKEDKK